MKTNVENSLVSLEKVLPVLESISAWDFDTLHTTVLKLVEEMGIKNGVMLWPIRTALSGKQFTPGGAFELAEILGKEESLRRVRIGIDQLKNA